VVQQARQLAWLLQDGKTQARYLPAPRSRRQLHRRLRRGLPKRERGGDPAALPIASGEFIRRKMGGDSPARGPRPSADLRVPSPGARAERVRRALREGPAAPGVGAGHASAT
jgi:hypothetical protein